MTRARRLVPGTLEGRCALLVFVAVAVFIAVLGRGERSGWILMTAPTERSHHPNTMLGYSDLHAGQPVHKENIPTFGQLLLFHGARSSLNMYAVRAVYAWIAAPIAPLLGVFQSLLLVNLIGWAAAAFVAWRLAIDLLDDRVAGLLAVVLVAGGIGMIAHIGDYSAHSLSFPVYYAGVLFLYRSGLWWSPQSLRLHAAMGCFLALAALQYNTGLLLTVAMVFASLGKQPLSYVALTAALGLTAQRIWVVLLNLVNGRLNDAPWFDFYGVERRYLGNALDGWLAVWQEGAASGAREVASVATEFLLFDSPVVVLLGVPAAFVIARRMKIVRLFALLLLLPFASGLVWAMSAGARGYLVYGVSILVYVGTAWLLATMLRLPGWRRVSGIILTIVVLGTHYVWSTAHLWGWHGPVKAYFLGWDNAMELMAPRPEVLSLTDQEETPAVFGGSATLIEAGAVTQRRTRRIVGSPFFALLSSSLFLVYLCGMAVLTARGRRAAAARAVGILCLGGFLALMARVPMRVPLPVSVDFGTTVVAKGEQIAYTLTIGESFESRLRRRAQAGDTLAVLVRVTPDIAMRWLRGRPRLRVGDEELPLERMSTFVWRTSLDAALAALDSSNTLTLTIDALEPLSLGGWQRTGLPGRLVESKGPAVPAAVPAFELRLLSSRGALKLAGF